MLHIAKTHLSEFDFLVPTIEAIRVKNTKPKATLRKILAENPKLNFEEIFSEFSKMEAIYGFGDSQVKEMLLNLK